VDAASGTILHVESVRPEDDVLTHEQSRDVNRVEDRDLKLSRPLYQRVPDLESGVVAGERSPSVGMCAEEAMGDASVLLAHETHPEAYEIFDAPGRPLGDDPYDARVAEEVAHTALASVSASQPR